MSFYCTHKIQIFRLFINQFNEIVTTKRVVIHTQVAHIPWEFCLCRGYYVFRDSTLEFQSFQNISSLYWIKFYCALDGFRLVSGIFFINTTIRKNLHSHLVIFLKIDWVFYSRPDTWYRQMEFFLSTHFLMQAGQFEFTRTPNHVGKLV